MPTQSVISESKAKMQKAIDVLQDELRAFRGGRATPGLVENIRVDYYGSPTPLKSLATISAPEVDMLVIKPFDPASVKDIEKKFNLAEDTTVETIMSTLKKVYANNQDFTGLSCNGILDFMPEPLLTIEGEETLWAKKVSAGLHILYNGSATESVLNLARKMVIHFSETEEIGFDASDVAEFLTRYAKELYETKRKDQEIFRDRELKDFVPIYSLVATSPNSKYLLIDFIHGGTSLDQLLEKFEDQLIKSDDALWSELEIKVAPKDVKGGTTDKFVQLHYKRLFYQQDNDQEEDTQIRYIGRGMWQYLDWELFKGKHNDIENRINERLNRLNEENQKILREYWGQKDREKKRSLIIRKLKEIAADFSSA